ncbi:MAG: hypothetical protein V4689_16920 [Verrucomicrobiota bacterium]
MNQPILPPLAAFAGFLVISCETQKPAPTYQEVISKLEKDAQGAVFPRVISPGWSALGNGKPEMDVSGVSRVSYVKNGSPKDVVEIFYHGQDNHRITTDDKSSVTVMGQKVQTYGSGNEIAAFATQPILLTAPNGKSAYYTFQFNNERLYKSRDIPQFGW